VPESCQNAEEISEKETWQEGSDTSRIFFRIDDAKRTIKRATVSLKKRALNHLPSPPAGWVSIRLEQEKALPHDENWESPKRAKPVY